MSAADRGLAWHLREVVRERASHAAIESASGIVTYAQLWNAAAIVARALANLLRDRPAPVALLLDHGVDVAIGICGTLRAGGIVAPLDWGDPAGRLAVQLRHLAPVALLVRGERMRDAARLVPAGTALVAFDDAVGSPDEDATQGTADDGGERPAWLYHTSGSAGSPKAVLHSHASLLHAVGNQRRHLAFDAADRFTWFALASTSQGGSNLLGALLTGGTLLPYSPRRDGLVGIPDLLRRERVTVYNSSATLFRAWTSLLAPDDHFPGLRVVRIGSERVRPSDVATWRRHFPPPCRLVNRYSCTEAGSIALKVLTHDDVLSGETVPVGCALPGKRVTIVGASGAPVPPGEVGEIVVDSRHHAIGYWRNDAATSAAFQASPDDPTSRRYFTGDVGRRLPNGEIEHLGRLDTRAKIRGHRVELEEIEAVLAACPGVRMARVIVERRPDGDDALAAELALDPAVPLSAREVRAFLRARLGDACLPASIASVTSMPLTPNGKLDRDSAADGRTPLPEGDVSSSPRTDVETALLEMWEDVLGVPVPGVETDFLALGGDSLQGTRILARVQSRWGVSISFEVLLDAGTIAALAAIVQRRR